MADDVSELLRGHEIFFERLREAALNAAENSHKTFLVLGGDHVFRSKYGIANIDSLHRNLLLPIINLVDAKQKSVFDGVVIVPGNHDIYDHKRQPGKGANEQIGDPVPPKADKFHRFKLWAARLQQELSGDMKVFTPFTEAQFRIPTPTKGTILFWAVNSAEKCGSLDSAEDEVRNIRDELQKKVADLTKRSSVYLQLIDELNAFLPSGDGKDKVNSYDPGYVNKKAMDSCSKFIGDTNDILRVAILHHNVLPTNNDDSQKYRFLNASEFNNFLLRRSFRVVLHGHQHIGEIAGYAKFHKLQKDEQYSSYLNDGFLSIGAPAFDIGGHLSHQRGFNIVTIEVADEHDVCRIQTDKHIYDDERQFNLFTTKNDIALRRVENPLRLKCLQDVNRIVFSEIPIRGLVRGLDSHEYRENYGESLRIKIAKTEIVQAIYTVAVFPPGYWLSSKIVELLLPLGRKNIKKAALLGIKQALSNSHSAPLTFQFSKPLLHGIRTATENVHLLPKSNPRALATKLKDNHYRQAHDFVASRLQSFDAGLKQMSFFGQASAYGARDETNPGFHPEFKLTEGAQRPLANFSTTDESAAEEIRKIFEFPRIVLWEPEDFVRPSTLDIIEFHENLGFPLFWIDPSLLRTKDGIVRKRIGSVSVLTLDPSDTEVQTIDEYLHEPSGADLNVDINHLTEYLWSKPHPDLWPLDKTSMGLEQNKFRSLGKQDRTLHEFIWLLGHPAICFAADAWFAAYLGSVPFASYRDRLRSKMYH